MLNKDSRTTKILAFIAAHPACTSAEFRAACDIAPSSDSTMIAKLHRDGLFTTTRLGNVVLYTITKAGRAVLKKALATETKPKRETLKIHGLPTPFKVGQERTLVNAMNFLKAIAKSQNPAERAAIWKSIPESYQWKIADRKYYNGFDWVTVKGDYYNGFSNVTITAAGREILSYWETARELKTMMR